MFVASDMDGVGLFGLIGLAAVLVLVVAIALLRSRYDGRLRSATPSMTEVGIALPADQVTVVQFTGEYCAVCPQAKTLVKRVLRDHPAIAHLEVDVADHLDAVRVLDIRRTPTLIIVDKQGSPVHRASGMPREAELRKAVAELAAAR